MKTFQEEIESIWSKFDEKYLIEDCALNIYDVTGGNQNLLITHYIHIYDFYFQKIGGRLIMIFNELTWLNVPLKEKYTYNNEKKIIHIYTTNDLMYELDFNIIR